MIIVSTLQKIKTAPEILIYIYIFSRQERQSEMFHFENPLLQSHCRWFWGDFMSQNLISRCPFALVCLCVCLLFLSLSCFVCLSPLLSVSSLWLLFCCTHSLYMFIAFSSAFFQWTTPLSRAILLIFHSGPLC